MVEKIKSILIDFDGTLVDSVPLLYQAYAHFVMILGHLPSQEEFITMNGFTADEMVACVRIWREINYPHERLLKLYMTLARHQYISAKVNQGAIDFLTWAKAEGYELGIVSSAYREWIEPILEREGIRDYFSLIVGKEDIELGKPDPQGFLLALKMLAVKPDESIAIDDSPNGIEAAFRAGVPAIQYVGAGTYHGQDRRALFFGNWPQILHYLKEEQ